MEKQSIDTILYFIGLITTTIRLHKILSDAFLNLFILFSSVPCMIQVKDSKSSKTGNILKRLISVGDETKVEHQVKL